MVGPGHRDSGDDMDKNHLGNGAAFSWQGKALFNCHVTKVTGEMVHLVYRGGEADVEWLKLPDSARKAMDKEYKARLAELPAKDSGSVHVRGRVQRVTAVGIFFLEDSESYNGEKNTTVVFIYGPGKGLADNDWWSGDIFPAGTIKEGSETFHAFAVDKETASKFLARQSQ